MRALVYHGPGQRAWEEVHDPEIIDEGDVIVRVDLTTICATDLHLLAGAVREARPCRILAHSIDGTQAEYVRVPYADTSTYRIPDGARDEEILMLADILPAGSSPTASPWTTSSRPTTSSATPPATARSRLS